MIGKLGASPDQIVAIRTEPEGDAKAMSDVAFVDELAAANAALDAYLAGNEHDGKRLEALTQHIGVKGGYSAAFRRHRKDVVALLARIDKRLGHDLSNAALNNAASMLKAGLEPHK